MPLPGPPAVGAASGTHLVAGDPGWGGGVCWLPVPMGWIRDPEFAMVFCVSVGLGFFCLVGWFLGFLTGDSF